MTSQSTARDISDRIGLHIVTEADEPSYAYEGDERRRIAGKNWAAIHIRGDRSAPVYLPSVASRRTWR